MKSLTMTAIACLLPLSAKADLELAYCGKEEIEKKICLSYTTFPGQRNYETPSCVVPNEAQRSLYYDPILKAFEIAPSFTKKYLCSLNTIWVDQDIVWNANANEKKRTIGFRRTLFERKIGLDQWMTGFFQYPFKGGHIDVPIASIDVLPQVSLEARSDVRDSIKTNQIARENAWSQDPLKKFRLIL